MWRCLRESILQDPQDACERDLGLYWPCALWEFSMIRPLLLLAPAVGLLATLTACSMGETTMIVWNNTDRSLEIVAERCQVMGMQIKPQQKRKCYVSLEPGSTLEVRDGDETLTKVVVDDQVSIKHDYLVPVAVGVPMVVVDYSQFYVVDSTLDRLFADVGPLDEGPVRVRVNISIVR